MSEYDRKPPPDYDADEHDEPRGDQDGAENMSQFQPPPPPPPLGPPAPPAPPPAPPGHAFPSIPVEAPGATTGLVLGILSIVLGFPVVQLILAYIGFTKSKEAKALCEANPGMYSNAGVASAGYICSIIGLVLGCLGLLLCCGYIGLVAVMIGGGVAAGP